MAVKWAKNLPVFSNLPFRDQVYLSGGSQVSRSRGAHLPVQVMIGGTCSLGMVKAGNTHVSESAMVMGTYLWDVAVGVIT